MRLISPLKRASRFAASCLLLAAPLVIAESSSDSVGSKKELPRPDHVIIVIEENKAYKQIVGNMAAPYINTLANNGALFTQSFAIAHPSQPNYLALFSGTTHGVTDDRCPLSFSGDNLAAALRRKGLSFAIYSESMPSIGFTGCLNGSYYRKHNPVVNWQGTNVAPEMN